jgi:membrane protease YdiL (CAAX protease family)
MMMMLKLIGINKNNDLLLMKPIILGINNPIVQNLSTLSIMISNVLLLSNSVLQFLFLSFIKFPIFITLKLLSSVLLRISDKSIELKQSLKNLSLKILTVADQVLLWTAPSKSSLIDLASDDNSNVSVNKSFIRINAAFLGPIKEELIFRYAFDKIWHGVGDLFSMSTSALIFGGGDTIMKETARVAAVGGSSTTPAWIWMNSILFAGLHMSNFFPIRKGSDKAGNYNNAWDNMYGAIFQCTLSLVGARFLFNPLYTKRGIAASIGAHIALNTFAMAFSFGGKPTDDNENSNDER